MAESLQDFLNRGNPNTLADAFRKMRLGDVFRSLPSHVYKKASAASALQLATLQAIALPDAAKAASVIRAYVRAGSVTGEYAAQAYGATPTTGQVAVAPNGDVVVLATDAPTDLDLIYQPVKGDVVEFTGALATGVLAIPSAYVTRGVIYLAYAEILTGTVTGVKNVTVPAAGLPATTKARLDVARANVQFNNATDAGTTAKVRLIVAPAAGADLHTMLAADAGLI